MACLTRRIPKIHPCCTPCATAGSSGSAILNKPPSRISISVEQSGLPQVARPPRIHGCSDKTPHLPRSTTKNRTLPRAMLGPALRDKHASTRPPNIPPRCAPFATAGLPGAIANTRPRISIPVEQPSLPAAPRASRTPLSHPSANLSRSNFPRFDFSKRGFCARAPLKNTPQPDLGSRTRNARILHVFHVLPRRDCLRSTVFHPPNRGENHFRSLPQTTCNTARNKPP